MDDETKAALERAIYFVEAQAEHDFCIGYTVPSDVLDRDVALIRAHIASETGAHDAGYAAAVADVVAWLRGDGESDWFDPDCADAVEAGAHVGAAKGGDDER